MMFGRAAGHTAGRVTTEAKSARQEPAAAPADGRRKYRESYCAAASANQRWKETGQPTVPERQSDRHFTARAQYVAAGFRAVISEAERDRSEGEAEEKQQLPAGGVVRRRWASGFTSGLEGFVAEVAGEKC